MIKEFTLARKVADFLRTKGLSVAVEIANYNRSADIAVYDNKKVWVIECKIKDYSRALYQLRSHRLSADYVYIATPEKNIRATTKIKLKSLGVGLMLLKNNGDLYIPLKPKLNKTIKPARKHLINRILERQG